MAEDITPDPSPKITDRDLARLVKRGMEEVANDPTATEIHERIRQRQNLEEDREHRERSDKSAVIGFMVGLVFLIAFIVGSIATFHP